jgi:hypothetical protein
MMPEDDMEPLHELSGNQLVWKQPKWGVYNYSMSWNGVEYGELYWTRWFSDEAIGKFNEDWWTFNRYGFFRRLIKATITNTDQVSASIEPGWGFEGEISIANGNVYYWRHKKFFGSAWEILDQGQVPVFQIEYGMNWFKGEAWIDLSVLPDFPDLPLLLCLAMYLIHCFNQDAAAGAAAATSTF